MLLLGGAACSPRRVLVMKLAAWALQVDTRFNGTQSKVVVKHARPISLKGTILSP